MFSKRLSEIDSNDIRRLVHEEVRESTEVEFKSSLPAKDGRQDPWMKGENKIGDRARNELLEEIIAFANAYGGHLIIGISETSDKPPRASDVIPLPQCIELADRLRLQCRDCLDPKIPQIEITGVPVKSNGAGVVICRVPKSLMAPHRHSITKECYIRRADRSEKMSMREIQDLTLQLERGITAIENSFSTREALFETKFQNWKRSVVQPHYVSHRVLGMRATLVPMTPVSIPLIHSNSAAKPSFHFFDGSIDKDPQKTLNIKFPIPKPVCSWMPRLRSSIREFGTDDFKVVQEVYANGLIEQSVYVRYGYSETYYISPEWVVCLFANSLCSAEKFRQAAGATTIEYGLEIELAVPDKAVPIDPYGGSRSGRSVSCFPIGRTKFPRYSVREPQQYQQLTNIFIQDFWNASGWNISELIEVKYGDIFPNIFADSSHELL